MSDFRAKVIELLHSGCGPVGFMQSVQALVGEAAGTPTPPRGTPPVTPRSESESSREPAPAPKKKKRKAVAEGADVA